MENKKSEEPAWKGPIRMLLFLLMSYGAMITTAKEPEDLFRIIGPAVIIAVILDLLISIYDKLK